MKSLAQFLLTFLANLVWQVTVIALVAALADRFLKSVTRERHILWVVALLMSLILPILSSISVLRVNPTMPVANIEAAREPVIALDAVPATAASPATVIDSAWQVGLRTTIILLSAYLILLLYRTGGLLRAWIRTRQARQEAEELKLDGALLRIVDHCREVFRVTGFRIFSSRSLRAPATLGVFKPIVILPQGLLRDGDHSALLAAIGHETVHVCRRDYLLNLICELLFLPLSFHPGAALIRRRLIQTRELRCDDLVAQRLLHPDAYARSLVQLASWAMPFPRPKQTMVVGIADGDMLEVRIMSLLKKTNRNKRRAILLAVGAALLLVIPCVAAASFSFNFDIDTASDAQKPEVQEKRVRDAASKLRSIEERKRFEYEAAALQARIERVKSQLEQAPNASTKAKLEQELQGLTERVEKLSQELKEKREFEYRDLNLKEDAKRRELEAKYQAELAAQARISMEQAIQIATSKYPGTVLECRLNRASELRGTTKINLALYRVVILTSDEKNPITTVFVNALDGTLMKVEKELEKTERPEFETNDDSDDEVLNGKAISLPAPDYPPIARSARADGKVQVRVLIDENGNVIGAKAFSGHPLLQGAAVSAARAAKFSPTFRDGRPVRVSGTLVYNFVME